MGQMKYQSLRDFLRHLESLGELQRIRAPVDPRFEITEICQRTLRRAGPALLFENPKGSHIPLLGNLFGTTRRIALAMGQESVAALRQVGQLLAFLKEPELPRNLSDAIEKFPLFRQVLHLAPRVLRDASCQSN